MTTKIAALRGASAAQSVRGPLTACVGIVVSRRARPGGFSPCAGGGGPTSEAAAPEWNPRLYGRAGVGVSRSTPAVDEVYPRQAPDSPYIPGNRMRVRARDTGSTVDRKWGIL